jgi:glycerol-3-phosphate dehydrogenase subunit B
MLAGVEAFQAKSKCIIIDFKGLRGFSSREVVANLQNDWPALTSGRLAFPGMESGEIYPEVMARALEVPAIQEQLAESVKEILGDAEVIGMPAIMGMHEPDKVMNRLTELIGKPLFEIPTMPPSVPGIRLREMFEQVFPQKGITLIPQQKVKKVEFTSDAVELHLTDNYGPIRISSQAVILASGRFLSGGLEAGIDGINEPLMRLHVAQPENRNDWYREQYMDSRGHDIHYSGIEVDDQFRPLTADGEVVDPRLFAAGIVLAHQDWIRGRCGAGVAIATAFKAVQEARKVIEDRK